MKPLTKYVLLFFCGLLLCGISHAQSKEIQLETKIITAFMQREEADSNIMSDDYDTIFIGYGIRPNTYRVYKYANRQLIKTTRIDTPYFYIALSDRGANVTIYPRIQKDTISLFFNYRSIISQYGTVNLRKDFSVINSKYYNKNKDSILRYYADFRKDSAYEKKLRIKYYEHFYGEGFKGMSRQALVRLLGEPDNIEMEAEKGDISVNNSSFYYNVDYTSEQNGQFTNTKLRRLSFIISNGFIYCPFGIFNYTDEVLGSSTW